MSPHQLSQFAQGQLQRSLLLVVTRKNLATLNLSNQTLHVAAKTVKKDF